MLNGRNQSLAAMSFGQARTKPLRHVRTEGGIEGGWPEEDFTLNLLELSLAVCVAWPERSVLLHVSPGRRRQKASASSLWVKGMSPNDGGWCDFAFVIFMGPNPFYTPKAQKHVNVFLTESPSPAQITRNMIGKLLICYAGMHWDHSNSRLLVRRAALFGKRDGDRPHME